MFVPEVMKNSEMLCTSHFYNKFQVACHYWLLLLGKKSNCSVRFKLEPITTYHFGFVVKVL